MVHGYPTLHIYIYIYIVIGIVTLRQDISAAQLVLPSAHSSEESELVGNHRPGIVSHILPRSGKLRPEEGDRGQGVAKPGAPREGDQGPQANPETQGDGRDLLKS